MALRFRVAGFPVQVHPLFFLTTLASGMAGWHSPERIAVWFGVVFLSVLLHELGHAVAFRRFGHHSSIALHGLGGTTTSEAGKRLTHRQDLWVSLAGPCAGFLLGGLVFALQSLTPVGQAGGLGGYAVRALLWVNIGWGIINLMPVLPLDGGHVMAALVRERGGTRYEWLIHGISLVTAAAGLVFAIVRKEVWLGMFALMLGVLNAGQFARAWVERRYTLRIRAASKRVRPAVQEHEAAASIEGFLSQLRLPSRTSRPPRPSSASPSPPPQSRAPSPEPRETSLAREPELPYDPQFVGEMLLDNGLAELAIHPLRSAFNQEPLEQTGHSLATAMLAAGRFTELTRLLAAPSHEHLGDETLRLIAQCAEAADQPALALRAGELLRGRTPRPARLAHDSKKPG